MKTLNAKTINEQQTVSLAENISLSLPHGQAVALNGDLAAGKSVFSAAVLRKKGVTGKITSPTYTIINEYETKTGTAYHMDAYRLTGSDELDFIGYYDALEEGEIILIEWAEIISDALPDNVITINITKGTEDYDERYFEIIIPDALYDKLTEAINAYIIH